MLGLYADIKQIIFICIIIVSNIFANDIVLPQESFEGDLPPRITTLVEHEQRARSQQELQKIRTIVNNALSRPRKKKKKTKTIKHATKKQTGPNKQNIDLHTYYNEKEGELLLAHVYNDEELTSQMVSLHIKKTSIKKALELLTKQTKLTFVVDPAINSIIEELKVENVPVSIALQSLIDGSQPRLGIIKHSGVWRIIPYAQAITLLTAQAKALKEQEQKSAFFTVNYAKWDEPFKTRIQNMWNGLVGKQKDTAQSFIAFDDATKKIFFKSHQQYVQEFQEMLNEIDQKIPQVSLEIRIVIADKNFDQTLGTLWSGNYEKNVTGRNRLSFAGIGSKDEISSAFGKISQWSLNLIPGLKGGVEALNGLNSQKGLMSLPLIFKNATASKLLNLSLHAAENKNEIKTILKPSLLVNSKETAEILVGESMPLQTRVDEAIGANISNVTTTQYKDLGIKVQVTPSVAPNNQDIFLDVFLENSSLSIPSTAIKWEHDGKAQSLGYTIKTSRSKNKVLLRSGQTTMISGLIENYAEASKSGVPFLQNIPIIGWLFKGTKKAQNDRQLLIFITPIVV